MRRMVLNARRLTWSVLGLILLLAPTQFSLNLADRAHLTLIEPLLLLAAGFACLDLIQNQRLRKLTWPPVEHGLFIAWTLFSMTVAEDRFEVLKSTLQFGLAFALLHLLVVDALKRTRRAAVWGLGLVLTGLAINLALAAVQYFTAGLDPLLVRGAFGNRNVLGGYLALTLPTCTVLALAPVKPAWRLTGGLLTLVGLLLILSGPAWLAVAGAVGLGLLVSGKRIGFAVWMLGLALLFTAVLPRLPRENDRVLLESADLYDGMGQPNFRYPEWQVAVNVIDEVPWRGVGAGNYQRQINRYYGLIPNPTGPQEPDIQNLYLVLGVSLGIPGLMLFLMMIGMGIRRAVTAGQSAADALSRAIGWGCAWGLTGFAIASAWSPLLVRGMVPMLAVLLATAQALPLRPEGDSSNA